MAIDIQSKWPNWGDDGSKPADGTNKQGGDPYYQSEVDYLWSHIHESFGIVDTEINDILNGNTTVPEANNAQQYKGNDIDTNGDGKVDNAAQADNADTVDGKHADDFHQEGNEAIEFIVENRNNDPNSPQTGREWIRTDL